MTIDSNYNSVVLLLHAEDGVLTDSSATPKTVTANGNAALSTAQAKFGSSSVAFDGTGDYLSTPNSVDFDFGSGGLTIEAWVYIAGNSSPDAGGERGANICSTWNAIGTASISGWALNVVGSTTTTGTGLVFSSWNAGAATIYTSTVSVSQSQWHHVAVTVSSGVRKLFLDGVLVSGTTTTVGAGYTTPNSLSSPLRVGMTANTIYPLALNGNIDDLRITKGVARYTADFTPPAAPFPNTDHDTASASLVGPAPTVSSYSGAISVLSSPPPMLYAGVIASASVAITAPTQTLSAASGASSFITAPGQTLAAAAHSSYGEQAAFLASPSPLLTITTGANAQATAPSPTLSASGTVTILAKAALAAPSPTLTAAGTVSGMAAATLTAPSPNLVGYGGAVCSVTLTGSPTLTSTGTTGGVGGAQVTCPLFQLSASATAQNRGGANLLSPSPRLGAQAQAWLVAPSAKLTAIGTAVVTATYEAYAVNLKHSDPNANDEITRYTNFPFTHVVRYQNSYYGANSTGLYLLEGTTDDVTPIPWNWKTATTDFKSPQNKTVASAYFGGRLGPADTITLHAGEGAKVQAYSYTTPRGALAQNYRQAFGKGIKSHRYYALEASGTGDLALDDISLDVHNLSRRI